MTRSMGGYGMTPNVIAQISAKVAMGARFLDVLALYHLRNNPNNSYGSQTKMCKTLTLGLCLT